MHTIEVDFDVYKQLMIRRSTEQVTYNDVIRELLGLSIGSSIVGQTSLGPSPEDWVVKGVRFPVGADLRATYKGQIYTGRVEGGALAVSGKKYASPSAAAVAITGSPVNGWRFWECRLPGKSAWQLIESLRR